MAKQLNVEMNFTANTSQAKQQLQQLKTTLDQITTGKSLNFKETPMNKSLQESVNIAMQLKTVLHEATNATTGKLDLTSFTRQMNSMGLQVKDVKKHLLNLGPEGTQAFIQMARSIQQADGPLVRINNKLGSMLTTLKNTAKWQISSSLLHGFMSAVSGAFRYAQDLNESLNNIRIRTGQSTEEMARFAEQANKAAQSLNTTTTAYTNAALIYYQQGLDDEQVKARTDITVKMANVTRDSAETVSQQLTAVWNNFDKGGEKLEYIADVMNALGAATASSTSEIATGLQKFAAAADAAGLSYEYAASALATITATTRQSADTVGTGLRTVLARIESLNLGETLEDGVGLTKYTKALESIGVQVLDNNGQLKEANDILDAMAEKWQGLTNAQKMATAETVGGIRQYTTIMALMENWDFMQKNLDVAYNAEGTLQEQADIYAESWEAASKRVKAAAQAIYSDLINDDFFITILNGAEKILTFIDDLIGSLGGLPGLLSTISTLMFNVFGDKIANSLTTMVQSLALFTKSGQQSMDAWKNSFASAGSNVSIDTFTYRGESQSAQFDGQIRMQQTMQENATRLSEEEQKILSLRQEQISKSFDLAEQYGIEADKQKEITAELEKQILNNTKSEEYTMQKERLRGFSASVKEDEQQAAVRGEKIDNLYNEETTVTQLRDNLKDLLKDFGVTEKEASNLFKTIKQGGGSSDEVIAAVDEELKHIPETAKDATKQIALMYNELKSERGNKKVKNTTAAQDLKANKEALKDASNNIPEKERAKYIQEMKNAMSGAAGTVDQYAKSVTTSEEAVAKHNNQLEFAKSQVNNFINAVRSAKPFENWATGLVSVAQGVSMMSMSINTVMGSIGTLTEGIANGNLTFSQFLSTIGAMGMSFTMIWPQLTKLASGFSKLSVNVIANMIASKGHTGALATQTAAMIMQTLANKQLTTEEKKEAITEALVIAGLSADTAARIANTIAIHLQEIALKKYLIIALAAVAIIAGLITLFTKMHEAELKAHKEGAEASKERADSLKEEVDANQELLDTYNQAKEAYDGTIESKIALEDAARKVAAAYGVENSAILIQKGNYEELSEAIDKARIKELERLRDAQKNAKNSAEAVFADSMHSFGDTYNRNISNGQINTHIETGGTGLTSITKEAIKQMGSAGEIFDFVDEGTLDELFGSDLIARAEDTGEGFQKIYESYSKLRDMIADMASDQGLEYTNDILYKNLNTWLKDHKEAYDAYIATVDELNNIDTELAVKTAIDELGSPKTAEDFEVVFDRAKELLEETGLDAEKATELLKAFFSLSADDTLKNLSQVKQVAEEFTQGLVNTSSKDKNEISNLIKNNSAYNDADVIANIDPRLVTSTEKFKELYAETIRYVDALQQIGRASGNIESVSEALDALKNKDYEALRDSLEWGKNGLMEFVDFLQLTSEQQEAYLSQNKLNSYFEQLKGQVEQIHQVIEQGKIANQELNKLENDADVQKARAKQEAWDRAAEALEKYKNIDTDNFESNRTVAAFGYNNGSKDNIFTNQFQDYADTLGISFDELIKFDKQALYDKMSEAFNFKDLGIEIDPETLFSLSAEEFADYYYKAMGNDTEKIALYEKYQSEATAADEEHIRALKEQLAITEQLALQEAAETYGVDDVNALNAYAESLRELLTTESEVTRTEEQRTILSTKMAGDIMQTQEGLDNLTKTFSDYADELENVNKLDVKTSEGLGAIKQNVEEIFGLDLDTNDLIEHLDDLKKLANGDKEAFKSLSKELTKDFVKSLKLGADATEKLNNAIDDIDYDNLKVGDELSGELVDSFNDLLASGKMTADQVEDALNALGYNVDFSDATVATDTFNDALQQLQDSGLSVADSIDSGMASAIESYCNSMDYLSGIQPDLGSPVANAIAEVTAQLMAAGYDYQAAYQQALDMVQGQLDVHEQEISTSQDAGAQSTSQWHFEGSMQVGEGEPTTVTGDFTNTTTAEGEGDGKIHIPYIGKGGTSFNGTPASATAGPRGGGGRGGGGGGGGSKRKPAKKQKVEPKKVDRYKEITDRIDDLDKNLEKANTESERLWGKDRLTSMQKANNILKEQIGAYKEKARQAAAFLETDKKALNATLKAKWTGEYENSAGDIERITESFGNLEFKFDADGDISNYTEIMKKLTDTYNARQAYWANPNNFADADAQSRYQDLYVKPMEEQLSLIEEAIKQYEETKGIWEENTEAAQEALREWQDNNLEQLEYKLELKVDINESELEKIEYYIDKLSDDFYQMGENLANYMDKLDNTNDLINIYKNQIDELNKAYQAGDISQEGYYEALKDINGEMYDQLETLKELDTTLREYFGETLDMGQEELEKYTDNLDHVNDMLDHYKNVMQLLGKETDYEMIGSFLDGIAKNSMNNYLASKQYYDLLAVERSRLEDELSQLTVGTEEYKFKKQQLDDLVAAFNDAEDTMLDKAEEAAEAFKAVWENTIESIKHEFEMLVTDGLGYDFLNSSLDRLETRQDEYLTKTNQLYEMNDLLRKLQADSDKTTNLAAKQRIANFSAEMEQLRDKNELSKLDLDIAKARYQQLLAQIALEEAQNAKSMVRLHRDNEGNYGYMYTADPDKVGEAEDALAKANNDLYNIVLEGTNKYSQLSLELTQQYQDDLAQLNADAMENGWFETEEYYDKLAQLQQEYYNLSLAYAREYNTAYSWLDRLDVSTTGANEAYTQEYRGTILANQELSYWQDMADKMQAATRVAVDNINPLLEGPDSLSSSLGTVEQAVADNVERSNEWTEAVIGEGGLVNALGAEFDQVLDKTNEYLKNHQKALYETIEAYEELAEKIAGVIAAQSEMTENGELTPEGLRSLAQEIYNSITFQGYDTGGYTGSWGSSGKLALLHEKELVLNKQDTENLLLSVDILRRLSSALDLQAMSSGLASISSSATINAGSNNLQQDVTIHAEFPNAVDHTEIEMAFDTLINRASQYAGR